MCRYVTVDAIYASCPRNPPHKHRKRLFKRCPDRPKPGPRCREAVHDPTIGNLRSSERPGPCELCRDSAVSIGSAAYDEDVRGLVSPCCQILSQQLPVRSSRLHRLNPKESRTLGRELLDVYSGARVVRRADLTLLRPFPDVRFRE